jgi:Xaa-Pro aminopeptidase
MFDFGGVVDGYSSDFGRTIYCGDPPAGYLEAYEVMLAARRPTRRAMPGTPAREVNAACRRRSRTRASASLLPPPEGHCIGMDVHERAVCPRTRTRRPWPSV